MAEGSRFISSGPRLHAFGLIVLGSKFGVSAVALNETC